MQDQRRIDRDPGKLRCWSFWWFCQAFRRRNRPQRNKNLHKPRISNLNNTDHLKVPKTITDKVLISRQLRTIKNRKNQPDVYVYTLELLFLGKWRSATDLQEWSLTSNNNLPMKSRFKTGKHKGLNPNILKASNIQTACKFKTPYKNLIFSNVPLHQEIDVEKSDNIGEG